MSDDKLLRAAANAAAALDAIYQWVDRVNAAGGTTCISGVASCNAMLTSLKSNRERMEASIMKPLRDEIAARQPDPVQRDLFDEAP